MLLTRHLEADGPRWALDSQLLPDSFTLGELLAQTSSERSGTLDALSRGKSASGPLLAPIDPAMEVWASGVTYLRSREAREAESQVKNVYERVYDAERPELFQKSIGWRAVGHRQPVGLRPDSVWSVPEPELTLLVDAHGEIAGYCAGNDLSSRDIEGENPLYLPQAKVFRGSCAIGPGLLLSPGALRDVRIRLEIRRGGEVAFRGDTSSGQMKRSFAELIRYLRLDLDFPQGVLLMTGTGIVPPEDFTLAAGDWIRIEVGALVLENPVEAPA